MENTSADVRKRYLDKINKIGYDPYDLDTHFFKNDPDSLPSLSYYDLMNYLIYGSSSYTGDQKRNYKSMDSYKLFIDGWVRDVMWKEDQDFYIVKSKVKTRKHHRYLKYVFQITNLFHCRFCILCVYLSHLYVSELL